MIQIREISATFYLVYEVEDIMRKYSKFYLKCFYRILILQAHFLRNCIYFESILFIQYVFCSFAAPGNFVDAFSNGYLLGELLHKYGLQVRKIYLQNLTRILETK